MCSKHFIQYKNVANNKKFNSNHPRIHQEDLEDPPFLTVLCPLQKILYKTKCFPNTSYSTKTLQTTRNSTPIIPGSIRKTWRTPPLDSLLSTSEDCLQNKMCSKHFIQYKNVANNKRFNSNHPRIHQEDLEDPP